MRNEASTAGRELLADLNYSQLKTENSLNCASARSARRRLKSKAVARDAPHGCNTNLSFQLRLVLERIHTTALGAERIRKNLALREADVTAWCREKISSADADISRKGKNWYISAEGCVITVNASSYTIITAHRRKTK